MAASDAAGHEHPADLEQRRDRSIQCHDDEAITASALPSGSGIDSPRPATRPGPGHRLGQHRAHAVVGLHGHHLVGPPDQQPGQRPRAGPEVDDRPRTRAGRTHSTAATGGPGR